MTNLIAQLPDHVRAVVERGTFADFATVSAAGVPIDTPTYYFPSDDLATLDIATGLAYPAKAERARRNPKVGMLVEGGPGQPVVSVRGRAAVRDSDFSANARRYLSETGFDRIAFGLGWDVARQAVWYWTRLIVEVTPERILWWESPEACEGAPNVLQVPADFVFPTSDPAPGGAPTKPSAWPDRSWTEKAEGALRRGAPGHLTVCDADGYPLPIRAKTIELGDGGFRVEMPGGLPFALAGKATLTFQGVETFVGEVSGTPDALWLAVERALPELPMMKDPKEVFQPSEQVRASLLARLEGELARRGSPPVEIPEELPAPTRLFQLRRQTTGADTFKE